jgi:hypothetical protein
VGRNTLIAVAIDTSTQSGTDFKGYTVGRFALPQRPTFRAAPARDRRAPYTFRFTGRLTMPPGVTARQGCVGGAITAQTKSLAGKTFSNRATKLRRNCSFAVSVTFRERSRLGDGRLKTRVRFAGNATLAPFTTGYRTIRVG